MNELVETPLSKALSSLTGDRGNGRVVVQDWRVIRALHLLLLIQATRLPDLQSPPLKLEEILRWDDMKIDQLAVAVHKTYALVQLGAPPQAPLFCPSHGLFVMPVQNPLAYFTEVIVMPLTPFQAVAAVPRDIDGAVEQLEAGNGSHLTNSSIGTAAPRVVVHPGNIENNDLGRISCAIEQTRARNCEMIDNCAQVNLMVQEAYSVLAHAGRASASS